MTRCEIYRNLHTGTWSVRALEGPDKGRVFLHPNYAILRNATFVVRPAGNAKVRAEGKKNVHAFVRGNLEWSSPNGGGGAGPDLEARKASYNPYQNNTFVDKQTGEPVLKADLVILDIDSGVWYTEGVV